MAIPEVPLSCCCDWGTMLIGRGGYTEWIISGRMSVSPFSELVDLRAREDGSEIEADIVVDGFVFACENRNSYTMEGGSGSPHVEISVRKYDSEFAQTWVYTTSTTLFFPTAPNASGNYPGFALPGNNGFFDPVDVDADGNVYFCCHTSVGTGGGPTPNTAKVIKLDSDGNIVWTANVTDGVLYWFFIACAVDLDGNVAAVGWRRNEPVFPSSNPTKIDWIVYYFDSDGNEVWHDDVVDSAPTNLASLGTWASSVCFDNAGNVCVGYSKLGTASKTFPFTRKYDSTGSAVWTKSGTATSRDTQSVHFGPSSEKLIVAFNNSVDQYSDSSQSTLDWTFNYTSTNRFEKAKISDEGHIYLIGAASSQFYKIDGVTGSEIYSGSGLPIIISSGVPPGRHPHFI